VNLMILSSPISVPGLGENMIKRIGGLLLVLVVLLAILSPVSIHGQDTISVTNSSAQMDFPLSLNFSAQINSNAAISDIRLRYQIQQISFADITSEAVVTFNRSTNINARYTLDMRKIGGVPPGTDVKYWWLVKNAGGKILESQPVLFHVTDSRYQWRNLTEGKISIYWYQGSNSFAQTLMSTAQQSLVKLEQDTGATPDSLINIYIYASTQDLQGSMVFPQEWTGGAAFTQFNIIAIGISPDNLAWGQGAMTHELTHIVISQMTANPYSGLPVWLNEGLAMYSQGLLEPQYSSLLKEAVNGNKLISVRSLASPFSATTEKSLLSYAESYTLIEFLITQYGSDKMLQLLETFREGSTYDGALQKAYGFDMDGLNEIWKAWITRLYNG